MGPGVPREARLVCVCINERHNLPALAPQFGLRCSVRRWQKFAASEFTTLWSLCALPREQ
jgi:hypothetical protein